MHPRKSHTFRGKCTGDIPASYSVTRRRLQDEAIQFHGAIGCFASRLGILRQSEHATLRLVYIGEAANEIHIVRTLRKQCLSNRSSVRVRAEGCIRTLDISVYVADASVDLQDVGLYVERLGPAARHLVEQLQRLRIAVQRSFRISEICLQNGALHFRNAHIPSTDLPLQISISLRASGQRLKVFEAGFHDHAASARGSREVADLVVNVGNECVGEPPHLVEMHACYTCFPSSHPHASQQHYDHCSNRPNSTPVPADELLGAICKAVGARRHGLEIEVRPDVGTEVAHGRVSPFRLLAHRKQHNVVEIAVEFAPDVLTSGCARGVAGARNGRLANSLLYRLWRGVRKTVRLAVRQ
jgi:hypothetical protein